MAWYGSRSGWTQASTQDSAWAIRQQVAAQQAAEEAARQAARVQTQQTTTTTPTPTPEEAPRKSALEVFGDMVRQYGLSWDAELEAIFSQALVDGVADWALIEPKLYETQAFKTRFVGWHGYRNTTGQALSISQYLALEAQYHQILSRAGLPAGFYDDPSDMGQWIAKNVSPNELQDRVRLAVDAAQKVDPTMRAIMQQFYGLSTGDVAAYFLDPNRALPAIEHQYKSAGVASWAARHGFDVTTMGRYEQLASDGVTAEAAMQGYGTVRALTDTVGRVASIYGESYGQTDAEDDVFFNKSEKRNRIIRNEQATFSGSSRGATGAADRAGY